MGPADASAAGEPTVDRGRPGTFNLLMDFRGLSMLLSNQLSEQNVRLEEEEGLNAFFVAAGLHQIVEDYLHREAFVLQRAVRLASGGHLVTSSAARTATALAVISATSRRLTPSERALAGWAEELARLVETLAGAAVNDQRDPDAFADARGRWARLREHIDHLPRRLLEQVMRLPNFPYSFDQTLDDCRELAERFAGRWPDRDRPLLVVGVRTSGTYLAPLYQALLRCNGYRDVDVLTVRQHQRWSSREVARVRSVVAAGGLTLLTDDPPTHGNVAARVAQDLQRLGARPKSIVLVLALFGPPGSLPAPLRPYQSIVLPWREWSIQERLKAASVQRALAAMVVRTEVHVEEERRILVAAVGDVERIDPGADRDFASGRGHAFGVYRVRFIDELGAAVDENVKVEGVGLGYFADSVCFIASRLAGYVPQVYAVDKGLLYHRCLPNEWRVDLSETAGLESRVVSYVMERRQALAVDADPTPRVEGYSVWRLVADMLGQALLGPLRSLAYPLTHAASRRLLAVAQPALIDGRMAISNWSAPPSAGPQHALKNAWFGGVICYDAAFDLASAAASFEVEQLLHAPNRSENGFDDRLLQSYTSRSGERIDGERWLLYQLLSNRIQLSELSTRLASAERERRSGHTTRDASADLEEQAQRWLTTERVLSTAHQKYIGEVLFADVALSGNGPLCAFDVDWVLETRWSDFPAITPAAAFGLRALMRHGFRPVIATGRSLREVQTRCRAFGLAGGVAEFGAVVYDHCSGRVLSQVGPAEQGELARLRSVLRHLPGVYLDQARQHGIRAVGVSESGERRGLRHETIQEALAAADVEQSVRVFNGGGQTDFGPISIDKGTGLRSLARELGADADADRPLAFAIGDDWPDFPMLELARSRFVLPNMSKTLQDELATWPNVRVTRDPHGAGVLQAVSSFLGHNPRRCRTCDFPDLSWRQRVVLSAFAGSDGPRRTRVRQAAALAILLLRRAPTDASSDEERPIASRVPGDQQWEEGISLPELMLRRLRHRDAPEEGHSESEHSRPTPR